MRQQLLTVLALVSALGVAGCAAEMPPLNFSVPNVGLSQHRLDAEIKSITVGLGRRDEQVGAIDFMHAESGLTRVSTGAELTQVWHTALREALDRTLIFRDSGPMKVSLAVKVLKLDTPDAGIDFVTHAVARYEIIDRSNGDIVFTQDVASSGRTPGDFAFLAAARARESVNRAVQNNISLFLQAAESIDLTRPMFPATS